MYEDIFYFVSTLLKRIGSLLRFSVLLFHYYTQRNKMKIALVCQSLLLSRALKSFLGEMVVPYKQCDFVISDKKIELDKPIFYISSNEGNLVIPFSKSSLLIELDKFFQHLVLRQGNMDDMMPSAKSTQELEEKITALTEKFRTELIQTIRGYYGN